jgi:hypothetical protein
VSHPLGNESSPGAEGWNLDICGRSPPWSAGGSTPPSSFPETRIRDPR